MVSRSRTALAAAALAAVLLAGPARAGGPAQPPDGQFADSRSLLLHSMTIVDLSEAYYTRTDVLCQRFLDLFCLTDFAHFGH